MTLNPRIRVALTTLWLLAMVSAGCDRAKSRSAPPSGPPNAPTARRFTDRLGRVVELNAPPKRIISLSPETTELMFAIGAGSLLVGVTDYCNFPEAAVKLPKVGGGTIETLSIESIVQLRPDLVLCKWDAHEPLIESLSQVKIQSFAVGPTGLEELYSEAELLGRIVGHDAEAESWVGQMRGRIAGLTERVASQKSSLRPKVFYQVWHEPLMSVNDQSFIGELLRLSGAENIFADLEVPFPTVNAEAVVDRNPDIILAPNTGGERQLKELSERPGWERVNAVRNHRIHLLNPDTISRCGPRLADALEEIVNIVVGDKE